MSKADKQGDKQGVKTAERLRRGPKLDPAGPAFRDVRFPEALLSRAFDRIEDAPVADSIPVFAGRERWQIWRRH